jgi:acetyl esterase/lipase
MTTTIRRYDPKAAYDIEAFDRTYRTGDREDWSVRIYQPQGEGPFPVLIDVHGGAWTCGNYLNNENIDRALATTGVLVMALEFRQSPHVYPAQALASNHASISSAIVYAVPTTELPL